MSSYIENVSKEEEENTQKNVEELIKSLGMANAGINEKNEETLRRRKEILEAERQREIKEQESKVLSERYKEEQEKRKAFEEEVRRQEEERRILEEEAKKKKEEENKRRLGAIKNNIKDGIKNAGDFFKKRKELKKLSPEDQRAEALDKKEKKLKLLEAELRKREKEQKNLINSKEEELKKQKAEFEKNKSTFEAEKTKEISQNKEQSETSKTITKETPDKTSVSENPNSGDEGNEIEGVIKKRVKIKKKPTDNIKPQSNTPILDSVPAKFGTIKNSGEDVGVFIPPDEGNRFNVSSPDREYLTLKDKIKEIRQQANMESIIEMVADIDRNKQRLIMIAIASDNMENLMLIRDTEKFLKYCEAMEDEIYVSYIYALYTDGPIYYLEKPKEELLTKIFMDIGNLFISKPQVTGAMLAQIPNIGIFRHIYI